MAIARCDSRGQEQHHDDAAAHYAPRTQPVLHFARYLKVVVWRVVRLVE
jgi:hypothetical protein